MESTVVLGTQFGDEGKGKLVDFLCHDAQFCCRFAGGNNAGHTIVVNGVKHELHILPSGLISPHCVNLVGSGCVVHIPSFFEELNTVQRQGLDTKDRLYLSNRAHVILDVHLLVDRLQEEALGERFIGTTRRGIGPTYTTKMARNGVRLSDVFHEETLEYKVRHLAELYKKQFGDLPGYDVEKELSTLKGYIPRLQEYVIDQVSLLKPAKNKPTKVVVEGAQSLMLDIDNGAYPFVTSSSTSLGGVLISLTIGWKSIKEVIGTVKAYTSKAGSGPFPTVQYNEIGDKLQATGHEWGVTTGRRRECGWLDLQMIAYTHDVNQYTAINLTKLDILDTFDEIKVATAYKLDGQVIDYFPVNVEALNRVEPVYETFPGWKTMTTEAKSFGDLPLQAREYVEFIEKFLGVEIKYIGNGPGRENMIVR